MLDSGTDISDDGRVIVGAGYNSVGTIIDNPDPGFNSGPSEWSWLQSTPGGYNTSYQFASPGSGDKWAKWTFHPQYYGSYEIFAQWAAFDNRAIDAPYAVAVPHEYWEPPAVTTVIVDQTKDGGKFNSVGIFKTYEFFVADPQEKPLEITLRDTSSGYVIADAIKTVFKNKGWMAAMN